MANYRTTIILKTDIVDSTPRLAEQTQIEMNLQRKHHKQFISETAAKHHGRISQEEGDAYWMEFPSVTNACFAALEMHQTLRAEQAGKGEKQRLVIRAVITLGDILHEENNVMGTTMSLTARIEKITPPDETYLSHAAWLALNKAELQTSFVNEFNFKGFENPEKVYKASHKHWSHILISQYILFSDVRGWTDYTKSNGIEVVENFLMEYDDILNDICERHNGLIRNASGDQYFLTFPDVGHALTGARELCKTWAKMKQKYQLGLSIALHKGDLNIIRSYLYSNDIHATEFLERLGSFNRPDKKSISFIASGRVKEDAAGTEWETLFIDFDGKYENTRYKDTAEEVGAYWFTTGEED